MTFGLVLQELLILCMRETLQVVGHSLVNWPLTDFIISGHALVNHIVTFHIVQMSN